MTSLFHNTFKRSSLLYVIRNVSSLHIFSFTYRNITNVLLVLNALEECDQLLEIFYMQCLIKTQNPLMASMPCMYIQWNYKRNFISYYIYIAVRVTLNTLFISFYQFCPSYSLNGFSGVSGGIFLAYQYNCIVRKLVCYRHKNQNLSRSTMSIQEILCLFYWPFARNITMVYY